MSSQDIASSTVRIGTPLEPVEISLSRRKPDRDPLFQARIGAVEVASTSDTTSVAGFVLARRQDPLEDLGTISE
jgi:hypothetical protein